jgi:shikimate kinase
MYGYDRPGPQGHGVANTVQCLHRAALERGYWRLESIKQPRSNLVLVGMPGSGKSTIGVILAKLLSYQFIDTDILIQTSRKRSLQDIVDRDGYVALRKVEEEILLGIAIHNHVIATGGSAVYSNMAMNHLRSIGIVVFLDVDLASLEQRIDNLGTRGLARRPGQSLADLFAEREPLYRKFADITVDCTGLAQEAVCARIIKEIESYSY